MSDVILAKINLSAIKAIAHDGTALQILIEQAGNFQIESLPAPEQAFQGLLQLARVADLAQQGNDRLAVRAQLLDEIKMIPVDSSTVAAVGYSDTYRTLQVDFVQGSRYRYVEVPSQLFVGFLEASSKGCYLNSEIKGVYDYERVY